MLVEEKKENEKESHDLARRQLVFIRSLEARLKNTFMYFFMVDVCTHAPLVKQRTDTCPAQKESTKGTVDHHALRILCFLFFFS